MSDRVNRIAYINLNGELETIAPNGEDRRVLTRGDRFFQFPAWSPNGRRIAAVGGTRETAGVFVFEDTDNDFAMPEPKSVYQSDSDAPIYLYWSPDNDHLSFVTTRPSEESMGLHIVSADDSAEDNDTKPVAVGRPCFWDWSTDGKRILLHTGFATEENAQLSFIDPFNPKSGRASIARPGLFQAPGIARSGQFWAFAQVNRKGELQLVVDGRSTSNRLLIAHNGIAAMSWSPAHDLLAYISPTEPVRTYYGPLRILDAVNGDVRTLTDETVLAFFWSPDGRYIAYFTVANVAEQIWTNVLPNPAASAFDGGFFNEEEQQPEEGDDFEYEEERVLRLNLWCVDVENEDHRLIKTFEPVDLFVNQFLPFFDQYALSHRIWSPDSTRIVLPMVDYDEEGNDTPRIFGVPMQPRGGAPTAIADGVMAFWSQQ